MHFLLVNTTSDQSLPAQPRRLTQMIPPSSQGYCRQNGGSLDGGLLIEENNLVGTLTLGRVNFGFMQIYAVEDLVPIDSLTSGLRDLTCVSLLTLAVDSFKVEVCASQRCTINR